MKARFLLFVSIAMLSIMSARAQDDAYITFDNPETVIRCVPSQTRLGVVTNPMAWPADAALDMGTPTPQNASYWINSKNMGIN